MEEHALSQSGPGLPPETWREQFVQVLTLSVPAILAQISSMAMQYIDAAMVGSLGARASASIGLVSTSTWLLGGMCISLATGFSVQVAHLIGAGREEEARDVLRQALLAGLVMVGGMGRVARVSERLVPAMALLYLGSGALVLLVRAEELPRAFSLIFSCALNPEAALGGGGGYALSAALRHGVARGVFTNEAGLGTSAMAHGAAQADHHARQGMWGIFEVFVSTLLVCSVTALVILVSGVYVPEEALRQLQSGQVPGSSLGVPLTSRAFASVLGSAGEWVVALSLILFAFSSILGWSCYGQQGLRYLTGGDRFLPLYRAVFLGCIVLGAVSDVSPLWQLVDLCNALMALPNLTALLLLSPQALGCLRAWAKTQK